MLASSKKRMTVKSGYDVVILRGMDAEIHFIKKSSLEIAHNVSEIYEVARKLHMK